MPSAMFFLILLLANLDLLNVKYMATGYNSIQLTSDTREDIKNPYVKPHDNVLIWTSRIVGYTHGDPTPIVPSYVASVSYGPHTSSIIYTCIWTSLLPAYGQSPTNFIQGPDGYSCKITQGKPGPLTEPVGTVQKPSVSSSTVAPETQPDSSTNSTSSVNTSVSSGTNPTTP